MDDPNNKLWKFIDTKTNEILGFAISSFEKDDIYLANISIINFFRNKELYAKMVKYLICKTRYIYNYNRIRIKVCSNDKFSLELYLKLGFEYDSIDFCRNSKESKNIALINYKQ